MAPRLPLTDVVVNPKDGALYFTIGGRSTSSGLYRVTYVGTESTAPSMHKHSTNPLREARKKLESFYGKSDPQAVDAAWPYLSHADRFLRYAARTVLEFQDPATWRVRALAEKNPIALTHAIIGLARLDDRRRVDVAKHTQAELLKLQNEYNKKKADMLLSLEHVDWSKLTDAQKIDYLRAYQLVFVRLGPPIDGWKERVGKRIDAWYPAKSREVNAELSKLISYLEPADGVTKTLALLAKAPSQEEQIEYALGLRTVKTGWTPKQHVEYFDWFHKAANYHGGNSFHKFLANIRTDAIKSLSDEERVALKETLAVAPTPKAPKFTFKKRDLVQKYTLDDLMPTIEKGMVGRDFDKGRNLFGEAKCFTCHRFANDGGGMGPDLTIVSGRYSARDLLEKVIKPSKSISDQYAAIVITTSDGQQIIGRVINLHGDNMMVNTDMLDPNKLVSVNRNKVESIAASKISMMPEGLLDTFTKDEILDLVAYLFSRGDRNHKMFRRD